MEEKKTVEETTKVSLKKEESVGVVEQKSSEKYGALAKKAGILCMVAALLMAVVAFFVYKHINSNYSNFWNEINQGTYYDKPSLFERKLGFFLEGIALSIVIMCVASMFISVVKSETSLLKLRSKHKLLTASMILSFIIIFINFIFIVVIMENDLYAAYADSDAVGIIFITTFAVVGIVVFSILAKKSLTNLINVYQEEQNN